MKDEVWIWLRVALSLMLVGGVGYGIYDLVLTGLRAEVIVLIIVCALGAWWVWPRDAELPEWLQWCEDILFMPLRIGFAMARSLIGLVRHGGDL